MAYTHIRGVNFSRDKDENSGEFQSPVGRFGVLSRQDDKTSFSALGSVDPMDTVITRDIGMIDGTYVRLPPHMWWLRDDSVDWNTFAENGAWVCTLKDIYAETLSDSWREAFVPYVPDKRWPDYLAESKASLITHVIGGYGKEKMYTHEEKRGWFGRLVSSQTTIVSSSQPQMILLGARGLSFSKTWWGKTVFAEW